ncbi:MAG: hypothetical protein Q4C54_07770 [Clostridia bacterium]|nr:hypothetical protein [Clostridia bacterium]
MTNQTRQVMSLRKAAMADCEAVPFDKAAGRVAAVSAGLYPPGIPLVCPGEEITEEIVALLRQAGERGRFGTEGDALVCVV